MTILFQLVEDVFVKVVKMLLQKLLFIFNWISLWIKHGSGRIGVHVWDENGLREGWLVVIAGALFSMTTRTNLPIERTIDSVLFCAKHICFVNGGVLSSTLFHLVFVLDGGVVVSCCELL